MAIRRALLMTGAACVVVSGCRREASVPAVLDAVTDTVTAQTAKMTTGTAPGGDAESPVALDTLRGVVQIVGNEPVTSVLLVPRDSATAPVVLRGDALSVVRQANGLDVMVQGQRTAERDVAASPGGPPVFVVTAFTVRAADGVTAVDGTLEQHGPGYALRLANDSVRVIGTLPLALRDAVGARVYLVGSLNAPSSWGVLQRRE